MKEAKMRIVVHNEHLEDGYEVNDILINAIKAKLKLLDDL